MNSFSQEGNAFLDEGNVNQHISKYDENIYFVGVCNE
jgi:hypothetical protein